MTDAAIRMISGLTVDFADFAMVPEPDGADGVCGECVLGVSGPALRLSRNQASTQSEK
jgi:hypothetical protein